MVTELDDSVLRDVYAWVDSFPLSRPKRNIARDFSDGVLMAEIIKHFFPKYVDLHNFSNCNKINAKRSNWFLLNQKVFPKLNFKLTDDVIDALISAKSGTIEKLLLLLRAKLSEHEDDVTREKNNSVISFSALTGTKQRCILLAHGEPIKRENLGRGRLMTMPSRSVKLATFSPSIHRGIDVNTRETNCIKPLDTVKDGTHAYQLKVRDCIFLQEKVEVLNAKVRRLSNLLDLKDARINELQTSLERLLK